MINITLNDLALNALLNLREAYFIDDIELEDLLAYGEQVKNTLISRGVPSRILNDSRYISDLQFRTTKDYSFDKMLNKVVLSQNADVEQIKEELYNRLSASVVDIMDEPSSLEILGIRKKQLKKD